MFNVPHILVPRVAPPVMPAPPNKYTPESFTFSDRTLWGQLRSQPNFTTPRRKASRGSCACFGPLGHAFGMTQHSPFQLTPPPALRSITGILRGQFKSQPNFVTLSRKASKGSEERDLWHESRSTNDTSNLLGQHFDLGVGSLFRD